MAVELYSGRKIVSDIDIVIKHEDIDRLKKMFFIKETKQKNSHGSFRSLKYNRNRIEFTCFDNINRHNKKYSFEANATRLKNCRKFLIDKTLIQVISPEELIVLKLLLDRNKKGKHDREDVSLVFQKTRINTAKLIFTARKYGVTKKALGLIIKGK